MDAPLRLVADARQVVNAFSYTAIVVGFQRALCLAGTLSELLHVMPDFIWYVAVSVARAEGVIDRTVDEA
jgi:hypothetical protein